MTKVIAWDPKTDTVRSYTVPVEKEKTVVKSLALKGYVTSLRYTAQ